MSNLTPTLRHDPPVGTPPHQPSARSFVAHARLISALTLLSRILGMAREAVAAHYFGAGIVWSAFTVAFTIPNLFRRLFGEGALSAAFIPLYAQACRSDEPEARRFAAATVRLLALTLLALTILGEGILALAMLWPMPPDRLLTLKFTAVMLPYVLLICGTALLGGILQVHGRFGPPAFAPVLLNIVHIAVIFLGAGFILRGGPARHLNHAQQVHLAYWLAAMVLVAGVLQIALLIPSLRQVGFRFTESCRTWTPAIRRMLLLTVPVALGAGVLQVSILLDKGLSLLLSQPDTATHFTFLGWIIRYPLESGAPARLNWAQLLYQFPLGVFAIALATAIFPSLSADAMQGDVSRFRQVLRGGVETTLLESLPASIGLIIVRYPLIRLLFEHGSFTPADTELVAQSLLFYSAGIWAFSLQQIVNRAYYALHDMNTPLFMAILALAVNLVVELPLMWWMGESGMAVGTAASFAVQALLMLWLLSRRLGGLGLGGIAAYAGRLILAVAIMWGVCMLVQLVPGYPHGSGRMASLVQLILLATSGALAYGAACRAMGINLLGEFRPRRHAA